MSSTIIAGLDEAGRGCLAGPVVAAACVFDPQTISFPIPRITDSKKMTEQEREIAFTFLAENVHYGIGLAEASVVDTIGILGATEQAMHAALAELSTSIQPTYLLIDGCDHFWFDLPHSSIIRGDEKEPCIAAASVLAKVTRDHLLTDLDEEFPQYGFAEHKGYGTPLHRECIQKFGPCPLHRRSFLSRVIAVP